MSKFPLFLFVMLTTFSGMGFAHGVTININASVIERSCTVSNNSLNQTVDLPGGDLRQGSIGIPFGRTPFSISLEDCPANISSAHIKFTGESDTTMNYLLGNVNKTDSAAQGVALGLYNADNKNINITNNKETLTINHDLVANSFDFFVSYVKVNGNPVAGKVTGVADFEIAYD